VFVSPEYNHSIPAALKNAIDYLLAEWGDKSAGFVSFGSAGGARAVEHLRGIMGEVKVADVRQQVLLSLFDDFENFSRLKPRAQQEQALAMLLDQVTGWGEALRDFRNRIERRAAA
jgi:NAD(P)H-dependent FMN reductase